MKYIFSTKQIAEMISEKVNGQVQSFKFRESRVNGAFESGVIYFRESKSIIDKVHLLDLLAQLYGHEIDGLFKNEGKTILLWNPSIFIGVKKTSKTKYTFIPKTLQRV